jgi:hypothetical protein
MHPGGCGCLAGVAALRGIVDEFRAGGVGGGVMRRPWTGRALREASIAKEASATGGPFTPRGRGS